MEIKAETGKVGPQSVLLIERVLSIILQQKLDENEGTLLRKKI